MNLSKRKPTPRISTRLLDELMDKEVLIRFVAGCQPRSLEERLTLAVEQHTMMEIALDLFTPIAQELVDLRKEVRELKREVKRLKKWEPKTWKRILPKLHSH